MGHQHGPTGDDPGDREVCVCFHVPRRKIDAFCRREKPRVISMISQCLSAGTGCGWCIPFLEAIHHEIVDGGPPADLPDETAYIEGRAAHHKRRAEERRAARSNALDDLLGGSDGDGEPS